MTLLFRFDVGQNSTLTAGGQLQIWQKVLHTLL
jgi:hypothetical protein